MIQVKRLGHATFKTPDLERIVDYWTRIIGLTLVERDNNRAFLATKYGEEAIAVEQGDDANLTRVAFQVAPGSDLGDVQKALGQGGHQERGAQRHFAGRRQGGQSSPIPKGTLVEIYSDYRIPAATRSSRASCR